jgi:hypothetical protein
MSLIQNQPAFPFCMDFVKVSEGVIQIESLREKARERLSARFRHLLSANWIPWSLVWRRHDEPHLEPMTALLSAYQHISQNPSILELSEQRIPVDSQGCLRCGACCSFMRPGQVSAVTFRKWQREGAVIENFFKAFGREEQPTYHCWFFEGVRLRMCPLLLQNVLDGRTFCAVHHHGPDQRHPACSGYRLNPPLCVATAYSLEN